MATISISTSTHSSPETSPFPPLLPPHPPPLSSLPMSHFPLWRLPSPPSLLVDNTSFPLPFLLISYFCSSSCSSKLVHKPSHSMMTSSASILSSPATPYSPPPLLFPPILPFSSSSSSSSNSTHEAFNTILLIHADLYTSLSFSTVASSIFVLSSPTASPSLSSSSSLSPFLSSYPPPPSLLMCPFPPWWFPLLPFFPFSAIPPSLSSPSFSPFLLLLQSHHEILDATLPLHTNLRNPLLLHAHSTYLHLFLAFCI